jgi:hypothetical protein
MLAPNFYLSFFAASDTTACLWNSRNDFRVSR